MKDSYNSRWDATHYTIAPTQDMPLATFKVLLDEFAKKCIRQKKETG